MQAVDHPQANAQDGPMYDAAILVCARKRLHSLAHVHMGDDPHNGTWEFLPK